jgi:hypothetical protein
VKTVPELIAYAKANPGKLNYGSIGTGGSVHLSTELFTQLAGIQMTHVPYKGQGPALNDLIGGTDTAFLSAAGWSIYPHVKASRLRAIAVTSPKRSNANAPTVPGVSLKNAVPALRKPELASDPRPRGICRQRRSSCAGHSELQIGVFSCRKIKDRLAAEGPGRRRRDRANIFFRRAEALRLEVAGQSSGNAGSSRRLEFAFSFAM